VLPVKGFLSRISLVFLLAACIIVILFGNAKPEWIQSARAKVLDVTTPMLAVIAAPIESYRAFQKDLALWAQAVDENDVLRRKITRLERIEQSALAIHAENARLRELLHYLPNSEIIYHTAKVVGHTGGPYMRSMLIASSNMGHVSVGQVVETEDGLVGRIASAGNYGAQIMLITDSNSSVPVIAEFSRERALIKGNNSPLLEMQHLPDNSNIRVGERILTSGDGEFFPVGIVVGVVQSVNENGVAVKPAVDWVRLENVLISQMPAIETDENFLP